MSPKDSSSSGEPGFNSVTPDEFTQVSPRVHTGPGIRFTGEQIAELRDAAAIFSCDLLHIGLQGSSLQFVIDHPDGVNVDHCADVSRQISALLDRDDYGASRYVLEVSSPGIERDLYWLSDYQRFAGEPAQVTFRTSDGAKRTVKALIVAADEEAQGVLTLELLPGSGAEERLQVGMNQIERGKLLFDP